MSSSQPLLSISRLRRLLHPTPSADSVAAEPPRKKQKTLTPPDGQKKAQEKQAPSPQEDQAAAPLVKRRHRRKVSKKRLQDAANADNASQVAGNTTKKNKKKKGRSSGAADSDLLLASKFRFLNEQLYTLSSADAFAMFQADPSAFQVYHAGYSAQRGKWAEDPLDWVAKQCRLHLPADGCGVLVDFGCGDARLAERLSGRCRRVHSLDLVALNERVTACDMAHSPLPDRCAHAAVFCLSLMNANLADFLAEASRVLRGRGLLCVVEARSRVERTQRFVNLVERFGFQSSRRREDKYLVYLVFAKTRHRKPGEPLPEIRLKPCLYKKR